MAVKHSAPHRDIRRPSLLWSRLHFLLRFIGLTGALCFVVALVLLKPDTWQALQDVVVNTAKGDGMPADEAKWIGAYLLTVGSAAVALALLVEALVVLFGVAGRRSAFGFNAVLQVAMATALLVGVNWWSFGHPIRLDWTREKEFTLPADLRELLGKLDQSGKTKVIVYLRDRGAGEGSDRSEQTDFKAERERLRQSVYRNAADRKVVDKVKDLVDLLRQVGPQLNVEVLDMHEESFDDKLNRLTKDAPELLKAIASAPENRIFIQGAGQLQQLSFDEFYRLDLPASQQAAGGRGNLVLLGQGADGRGIRPFVRKVVNLEQRRPRVGVLVIHPVLSTEAVDPTMSLAGLRKALALHGFEVKDVILKRWERAGPEPEPSADTFAESKLEGLEAQLTDLEDDVKELELEVKSLHAAIDEMMPKPGEDLAKRLEELSEKYKRQLRGRKLTAEDRDTNLALRRRGLQQVEEELASKKKEREAKRAERDKLDVDSITEARRMTDVKAKLAYALADCDVLFIPRMTRLSHDEFTIPPRLYRLDRQQVDAIKDFVKSGKPILACFGPVNERTPARMPPGSPPSGPDGLDFLFSDLGIRMSKQTILTAADTKAFSERRVGPLTSTAPVEMPLLDFDSGADATALPWRTRKEALPPNPLREGLRVTAHSLGAAFDIRMRFPRPIYYEPPPGSKPAYDPTFLLSPVGWNEDEPYPTPERRPRFTPPAADDPNTGTLDARRRGQFPVGVAVETPLPEDWGKDVKGKKVRVAAIGQGELFVGEKLSPAKEALLLETTNWLLGRDEDLPREDQPWSYPRLALTPDEPAHRLWLWGAQLGLPVLFAYLGLVVLLFRRLR